MGEIENTDDIIKAVANSKYYRLSRDEMWEKNIELDVETESLRKQIEELNDQLGEARGRIAEKDKEIEGLIQKEITEHTALIDKIAEQDKRIDKQKEALEFCRRHMSTKNWIPIAKRLEEQ